MQYIIIQKWHLSVSELDLKHVFVTLYELSSVCKSANKFHNLIQSVKF
jgi:hypothetical protein